MCTDLESPGPQDVRCCQATDPCTLETPDFEKIEIKKLVKTSIYKRGELDNNDKNGSVFVFGFGARSGDRPGKHSISRAEIRHIPHRRWNGLQAG